MQNRKKGEKLKAGELEKEIGYLLVDKRKRANLRQEDVAKIIDVSLQQYQKYENATNKVSLSILFKIFDSLGMHDSEQDAFLKIIREKNKKLNK